MTERLRLVGEQIRDAQLEIQRLEFGTADAGDVRFVVDLQRRRLIAELKKMSLTAPGVVLEQRARPIAALDAFIRGQLEQMALLPRPKLSKLTARKPCKKQPKKVNS